MPFLSICNNAFYVSDGKLTRGWICYTISSECATHDGADLAGKGEKEKRTSTGRLRCKAFR